MHSELPVAVKYLSSLKGIVHGVTATVLRTKKRDRAYYYRQHKPARLALPNRMQEVLINATSDYHLCEHHRCLGQRLLHVVSVPPVLDS